MSYSDTKVSQRGNPFDNDLSLQKLLAAMKRRDSQ